MSSVYYWINLLYIMRGYLFTFSIQTGKTKTSIHDVFFHSIDLALNFLLIRKVELFTVGWASNEKIDIKYEIV